MSKILWFSDITFQTPVNEIGWTYVLLALLIVILIVTIFNTIKELKS